MDSNRKTFISFKKTSCYFCSEWLNDENIKDHLTTCGQVLEKCPHNCEAFIQRKDMEDHIIHCRKRLKQTDSVGFTNSDMSDVRLSLIEENLVHLREQLNNEIHMRHQLIADIGGMKKRNQITDEWVQKVSNVLNMLQRCIDDEKQSRQSDVESFQTMTNKLADQIQELNAFRADMNDKMNTFEQKVSDKFNIENVAIEFDAEIKKLETEIRKLKFQSSDDVNDCVKYIATVNTKLAKLEEHYENQCTYYDSAISQIAHRLEKSEGELLNVSSSFSNFMDKYAKTDFDVKQLMNIIHEVEDRSEKFAKVTEQCKSTVSETRQSLADLEEHVKVQRNTMSVVNTKGHLLWKIDDYSVKIIDAKENGTMLRSPLFSNRQYGYTLRLDVYLNGIGTWKNRNIIACLTVCNGEYDTLLPWPCTLKADILLRDQPKDINEARNIFKSVVVRKNNDQIEYPHQYIHVPHSMLDAPNNTYIRDDAIFFEVRVQRAHADTQ